MSRNLEWSQLKTGVVGLAVLIALAVSVLLFARVGALHGDTTEIYVVLEGEGFLELDGDRVPVKPLSAVMIRPGCRHRAVGRLKILNIPVPKHDDNDFYYDEGAAKPGETPVH